MKGIRIKTGAAKAMTLLTAYLLSTVGTALIALTCHCEHLHHHDHDDPGAACLAVECCCGHDHAGHSAACDRPQPSGTQLAERCCDHNHSTDTELYTADSNKSANIRITVTCTDAVTSARDASDAPLTALKNAFAERRCPPAQKCRAVTMPLRAPPVCA